MVGVWFGLVVAVGLVAQPNRVGWVQIESDRVRVRLEQKRRDSSDR